VGVRRAGGIRCKSSKILEMFFGILFASLWIEKREIELECKSQWDPMWTRVQPYLGRLADFLSDDLPLVCLVLLDCVTEFYGLRKISGGDSKNARSLPITTKVSYLIFGKFSVMHILN
jgi:hypothetical protein